VKVYLRWNKELYQTAVINLPLTEDLGIFHTARGQTNRAIRESIDMMDLQSNIWFLSTVLREHHKGVEPMVCGSQDRQ
jgi:hypothetical protein